MIIHKLIPLSAHTVIPLMYMCVNIIILQLPENINTIIAPLPLAFMHKVGSICKSEQR